MTAKNFQKNLREHHRLHIPNQNKSNEGKIGSVSSNTLKVFQKNTDMNAIN